MNLVLFMSLEKLFNSQVALLIFCVVTLKDVYIIFSKTQMVFILCHHLVNYFNFYLVFGRRLSWNINRVSVQFAWSHHRFEAFYNSRVFVVWSLFLDRSYLFLFVLEVFKSACLAALVYPWFCIINIYIVRISSGIGRN